ncbi:MAG: hypothetical protein KBC95_04810 [Candidatus Peribacteraceae bacterium]|nr:hypothetical protein [Candidatus Peribacteraceae bacterium]
MPSSPSTYQKLFVRAFDAKSLADKVQNKLALQRELGWPAEPKAPMLCLPEGMTDELGGALLKGVLPGLVTQNVQLLIRGKGGAAYATIFSELQTRYPHRIAILPNTDEGMAKMLSAADMALFLAPAGKDDATLKACMACGVLPVGQAGSPLLENYDPVQESGTAFTYEDANPWHVFAAIVRALETFKLPYDWRTIQRHGMEMAD